MERPKLKPGLSIIDYIVEAAGLAGLIFLVAIPVYFYNDLPASLPKHFNFSGQPDSFGGRNVIWLLPVIGAILYTVMTILNRYPHVFNYPVEVTAENASRLYTFATRTIRLLKTIIVLTFLYLNSNIILTGLGRSRGLSAWFVPVFLITVILLVVIVIIKSGKRPAR